MKTTVTIPPLVSPQLLHRLPTVRVVYSAGWLMSFCLLHPLSAVPAASGVTVTWLSESGVTYFLERSTNLAASPFLPLATNITGEPGVTTYTDGNAAGMGPSFYRVGVGE